MALHRTRGQPLHSNAAAAVDVVSAIAAAANLWRAFIAAIDEFNLPQKWLLN